MSIVMPPDDKLLINDQIVDKRAPLVIGDQVQILQENEHFLSGFNGRVGTLLEIELEKHCTWRVQLDSGEFLWCYKVAKVLPTSGEAKLRRWGGKMVPAPPTIRPYEMSQEDYIAFMEESFQSLSDLIKKKNSDYTSGGSAFSNFNQSATVGIDPLTGLVLRMQDKFQRILSFINAGELKGESVEDAFKDLQGYSMIALGMMKSREDESE